MPTSTPALSTAPPPKAKKALWKSLGFQIVVAMVLGAAVGFLFPAFATQLKILGDIFLRLIKTAVAPLVSSGTSASSRPATSARRQGRLLAMLYFEIVSPSPWPGLTPATCSASAEHGGDGRRGRGSRHGCGAAAFDHGLRLNIFDSFVGALAGGELLQVLVIAMIFGGPAAPQSRQARPHRARPEHHLDAFFEFIHIIAVRAAGRWREGLHGGVRAPRCCCR
jgi:aerobic C4-dicarboxylate transport protein